MAEYPKKPENFAAGDKEEKIPMKEIVDALNIDRIVSDVNKALRKSERKNPVSACSDIKALLKAYPIGSRIEFFALTASGEQTIEIGIVKGIVRPVIGADSKACEYCLDIRTSDGTRYHVDLTAIHNKHEA